MENQELEYKQWLATQPNSKEIAANNLNRRIENQVKEGILDTNLISDGYHTFGELYEHRIQLWIALCKAEHLVKYYENYANPVWRSLSHSDGSSLDGWFILGINNSRTGQITYHLPISKWDECSFAETLDKAPEFDGHTSADVLERLKSL